MKIAIPTRGQVLDDHFGHCEMYQIYTVDENRKIVDTEYLPSAEGCGCKSNIASVLKNLGVGVMLAGGIGDGAIQVLNRSGIKVIRGCSGNPLELVNAYLENKIADSGESCAHHHDHHESGHACSHQ
jgi:predicted Fe-Mo cluster-binding NifX family protein